MSYRPKGMMCMACTKLAQDCSVLDFTKMQVVAMDKDGTKVVKCSNYDRSIKMNVNDGWEG